MAVFVWCFCVEKRHKKCLKPKYEAGKDILFVNGIPFYYDTEIKFEGKIVILDGDQISVESSADTPKDEFDLPIRTEQNNPENQWYLYTKTLRYPVSYTDWLKIGLMPTTKIFTINLAENLTDKSQSKSKSKKK